MSLKSKVYLSPPKAFTPTLAVAGCFCVHEEKFLLLKRHPDKPQGSRWGLPAGKVEEEETPLAAAIRETYEETGVQLSSSDLKPLSDFYIQRGSDAFTLHIYAVELRTKPALFLKTDENIEALWLSLEEALQLPLLSEGSVILQHCESLRRASEELSLPVQDT